MISICSCVRYCLRGVYANFIIVSNFRKQSHKRSRKTWIFLNCIYSVHAMFALLCYVLLERTKSRSWLNVCCGWYATIHNGCKSDWYSVNVTIIITISANGIDAISSVYSESCNCIFKSAFSLLKWSLNVVIRCFWFLLDFNLRCEIHRNEHNNNNKIKAIKWFALRWIWLIRMKWDPSCSLIASNSMWHFCW